MSQPTKIAVQIGTHHDRPVGACSTPQGSHATAVATLIVDTVHSANTADPANTPNAANAAYTANPPEIVVAIIIAAITVIADTAVSVVVTAAVSTAVAAAVAVTATVQ